MTSVTDPLGGVSRFAYDANGNMLSDTDPNGHPYSYRYDAVGNPIAITDPLGQTNTFAYDGQGNLTSVVDPLGHATSLSYDRASRAVGAVDPRGLTTKFAYNALDRLVTRIDALGSNVLFVYDPASNLVSIADERANTTTFSYDPAARILTATSPLGKTEGRSYDLSGNPIKYVDRRGETAQIAYDALNHIVQETYQDGSTVGYSYDGRGRLVRAVDSQGGTFDFAYDADGRLLAASSQFGTVQYSYDADDRVTSRQVSGQPAVQYTYDAAGNLVSLTSGQASVNLTYDARNQLTAISRSSGLSSVLSYDAVGYLVSITHTGPSGALGSVSYTYDADGHRLSLASSFAQPLTTQALTGQFDAENRLTQMTSANGSTSYSYDGNGNLISAAGPGGTTNYSWDARNRLQSVSIPNGQKTTFLYDFARNLISTSASGPANLTQNFVLDDLTNIASINRSDGDSISVLSGRLLDDDLAVLHSNGQTEYSLKDGLHSTVTTADQTGKLLASLSYEPYGQTSASGSNYPFQFTGRTPVGQSLYYYRQRYFDSTLGRFLSEDPARFVGGASNLFTYVLNDPVDAIDPNGLDYVYVGTYNMSGTSVPIGHSVIGVGSDGLYGLVHVKGVFDSPGALQRAVNPQYLTPIHVSPKQARIIRNYLRNARRRPPRYDLKNYNCANFARDTLVKAGVLPPLIGPFTGYYSPLDLMMELTLHGHPAEFVGQK